MTVPTKHDGQGTEEQWCPMYLRVVFFVLGATCLYPSWVIGSGLFSEPTVKDSFAFSFFFLMGLGWLLFSMPSKLQKKYFRKLMVATLLLDIAINIAIVLK